jgi:hypothetical protein
VFILKRLTPTRLLGRIVYDQPGGSAPGWVDVEFKETFFRTEPGHAPRGCRPSRRRARTVCKLVFGDGRASIGETYCSWSDRFVRSKGYCIAFTRASQAVENLSVHEWEVISKVMAAVIPAPKEVTQ